MLADVTKPVEIKATRTLLRESGDFLRRVCFVSFGETTLLDNEFKEVNSSDFRDVLNGHTELTNSLTNFFARANNKTCLVLEVGNQTGTALDDDYDNKIAYLKTQNWFDINNFYKYIYTQKWLPKNTETTAIIKAYWNSINTFNESQYQQYLQSNRLSNNVGGIKKYLKSLDLNWDKDYYSYLAKTQADFKEELTKANLDEYLTNREANNYDDDDYHIYLEEHGTFNTDYSDKIEAINKFIADGLKPCYVFVLPNKISQDENISKDLFALYDDISSKTYFYVNLSPKENMDLPCSYYTKCKEHKSVAMFYDNTEGEIGLASMIAGVFASNTFDISINNPATPINYKNLAGCDFVDLNISLKNKLVQAGISFVDSIAQNILILNGRFADLTPIDYWYQWDLTSFNLQADLTHLIINGVNNPTNIIKYNQQGLDILESRVKATLKNMISNGCITEYAARLHPATGEMESRGEITMIDFNTYITQNPKDYENEIYNGISFYLRIGKYLRQVIVNATLG